MAVPSCIWGTVQEWADLAGQDPSFFEAFLPFMGSTYMRVCDDGTVMFTEDMFMAIQNVP